MSLIQVTGLKDATVPYSGTAFSSALHARLTPVPTTVGVFEALNRCSGLPHHYSSSVITTRSYVSCTGGSAVTLTLVKNQGHAWPSLATGFDATAAIWSFFSAHPQTAATDNPVTLATQIVGSARPEGTSTRVAGHLDGRFDVVSAKTLSVRVLIKSTWLVLPKAVTDFAGEYSFTVSGQATAVELATVSGVALPSTSRFLVH